MIDDIAVSLDTCEHVETMQQLHEWAYSEARRRNGYVSVAVRPCNGTRETLAAHYSPTSSLLHSTLIDCPGCPDCARLDFRAELQSDAPRRRMASRASRRQQAHRPWRVR